MAPSSTVGTITIKNTHTVTVTAPVTIDQTTVESGATLTTNASQTLTVNDGTGNDLTVDGTLNIAHNLANNGVVAINGTLQINSGGFVSTNAPTYAAGSTLVYNTGGSYGVGTEWTGNATMPGLGVPANVTIQNSTTVNMPNSNRGIAGNLNINSGALNLNVTSGDLYLTGNWTRAAAATFTPNNRAVFFNGSGAQTVTISGGGGTETFNYLLIQNSATLTLGASTNITVNSPGGLTLSSSAASNIDLANHTFTLSGGGNLSLSSGARAITSSPAGGIFAVTSAIVTVTNGGSLGFASGTVLALSNGFNSGAGLTTVNGTLQINNGGFISSNPPIYGTNSLLRYNSGTNPYGRGPEWTTATSGPGYPHHVQVSNNTVLDYPNSDYTSSRSMAGDLTVDFGSSFFMDWGLGLTSGSLTVGGNVVLNGNLSLGDAVGSDIIVGGNWTEGAASAFTANDRALILNGTGTQTISRSSGTNSFPFLNLNKTAGGVSISNDVSVSNTLTLQAANTASITTGANTLIVSSNATGAIVRTGSGHVNGNLRRAIAAGANTYLFPLGSTMAYTPASIDFGASTVAGNLTGFTANGDHPNLGTSTFTANKTVNRYWDFTVNSGLGTVAYDATFTWVPADKDAGYIDALGQGGKFSGGTWTYPTTTNQTATSAKMTGLTAFSGFQMGNSCPAISAVLSGDATICAGSSTNLSVAISGGTGPYTVVYSGGTVNSYNSADPIPVSPGSTTMYTLTSVTDANSCTATVSGTATVTVNTPATADAGGPYTTCGTTAVAIAATTNGTGTWSGGAGTFASATSASTTYTPTAGEVGGTVTLTWTTDDPDGAGPCTSASDNATLTVNTSATADAGGPYATCGTTAVAITATASGSGSWSGGTGTFASATSASTTYTPAAGEVGGTVTLTWTTDDPDGAGPCTSASDNATLTVNTPATADAGGPYTTCGTTAVAIAATTNGTGTWSGGAGTFASATSASTSYTPTAGEVGGMVTLTWTTDDPDGAGPCTSASDNATLTVNTPATADAGGPYTTCGTTAVAITATTNGTGTWSGGAGTFANANNASTSYTPAAGEVGGTVTLTWTTDDPDGAGPCTSASDNATLTVNTSATADAGGPYATCGTTAVTITATASGTGTWSGGAGTFASATSASTSYTPTAGEVGTTVTLTWTTDDPDGAGPCTAVSDNATLTVGSGEIDIEGNGNPIADGDLMPTTGDNTDFGNTLVTGGTVTRTFTIKNTSLSCPLSLNGSPLVLISGLDAADFNVTVQPSATILANSSTTFTVVFDPSAAGLRTATVIVANDDTNENPYNFSIQGTGDNCPTITFTATPTNACGSNSDGQIAVTGVTGGTAPYMYSIDNGMNYVAGATFTGLAAGTYQVKVKDANNCESAAVSVTVGSTPITFMANAGPDETTCVNGIIQLNGSIGGGATSSTWSDGGVGGSFSNATALSTFYTPPFNYSSPITITLTTNGPCPASDNLTLTFATPAPLVLSANGPASATCGDNITITIKAEDGFDDIASDQFSVNWDPTKLQYVSHTNPAVGGDASGVGTFQVASGQITYAWFDVTAPNGEDLPDGSTLMTITLKVLQSSGTVGVNLSGTPTGIEATNNEYCFLTVNTQNNASAISLMPITVSISGDLDICQGENTTLTASGGTTYLWSPGGATTAAITVSPSSTTTYTVTVTGTGGCTNTAVAVVTVTPLPSASISGDLNICPGENTVLTASGGSTYLWSTTETTAAITVSPTTTTTYTVTVTNSGCSSTTSAVVTVQPAEIVNAGPDQSSCIDGIIYLNGSVSGGATGGTWSDGGAGGSFIQFPNPTSPTAFYYPPSGNTLPITLTLTSNGACPTSDQMTVTYGTLPPLELAVNAPANATCGDVITVTLVANSGFNEMQSLQYSVNWNAAQLQYQSNTPLLIGGATPSINLSQTGTGKLGYSWTDNSGFEGENLPDGTTILTLTFKVLTNSVTSTISIGNSPTTIEATTSEQCILTVNTTPAMVALNPITVTCPADFAVCVDVAPFALSGGTPAGGTYSGPGVSANTFNPAAAAIGPNTITYSYMDMNGCSNSCTFVITVNPRPTANITVTETSGTTNDDGTICNGASATLTASGGGTYLWSNAETTASITVSPTSTTTYTVTVTLNGCTTTVQQVITVNPIPTGAIVVTETSGTTNDDGTICNGASATLTASGGGTYLWSNTETTASITISPTSTTTYTVTVTLNGCTTTVQQVITVNPIPTGAIAVTETSGTTNDDGTICNGASATLTASGGGTYLWSNTETTASITVSPTSTTTYTVTVTLNGCTTTVQQVITVNPIPTGAIAVTETSGTTNDDGTICAGASATLTASGGGTYLWSPGGETTAAITVSPTSTTTYTVTVTLNGCTTTVQQVITVNPIPTGTIAVTETSGTTNDDGTICAGASATLTASGGGTYLWSPGGETTASITVSPTSTTTYTVTVTLNGCTTTVQQVITVNPIPTGAIAVTETSGTTNDDGTICNGASATLTASGGGTYLWSNTETTASITVSPTSTTTYTVTVTLNGCTTTVQQVITVNPIPTGTIAVTETSGTTNDDGTICNGASATLTASGGGTYLWSNTETTASITVSPTSTTTYTVTITLNGCTTTVQQVITVNPIPTGAIAVTETSGTTNDDGTICAGASATLTASGGGTYLWSNAETTASITVSPTSTTTYTVTVTLNGCTTTVQQVITVNPIPTGVIAVTETSGTTNDDGTICAGASATLTASGGGTYLWSPGGETTAAITVSPTSTTTYTVTVTLNGCTTTVQQVITVNPIPTGAIVVTETSGTTNDDGTICNGASATLTASGGGTYLWSPGGETTAAITVSPTSTTTYTVTVTLNGCTTTVQQVITVNPIPTGAIAVTETSGTTNDDGTICNGASATLTASGGGTYLWSTAETTASITVSPTSTTTYTVTVTLNGCTTTVQQVITVNPIPTGAIAVTETSGTTNDDGTICNGASATLTASGGGTYLWSNAETTASITVSPTSTTTYTVTVTLNGCTTTVQQVITVNPIPTGAIAVTETSGTTNDDGTICAGASATLTASGGGTYLWSNAETTASITVSPTSTTTYTVTVTLNGCTTTVQQVITVNPIPTGAIAVTETSGTTNDDGTICNGASATLTASGGGTYLWSTAETTASITVSPTSTTTYTVTITLNGCTTTVQQVITVNPIPTGSIAVTETSGTTNDDGTICAGASATLTASGGGTYLWSPGGETTAAITVSPTSTTTYTVTVTLNGCTTTVQQVITVNPIPTGAIAVTETSGTTNDDGTICNGASATLTASGGGTYLWSNTETTASITVSPTSTTTYTVTVTLNGCTTTVQQVITVNPIPTGAIAVTETSGTTNDDGTICNGASATLTASGGGTYLWSNTETTASITVSPTSTTTYTVTVTLNGCTTTVQQVITVNPIPTGAIAVTETSGTTNDDGTICNGASATLTASGGGTYLWSNTETTASITISPTSTTTYTVTVTLNGCTTTVQQVITVNPIPTGAIAVTETSGTTNDDGTICNGASATLTASGGGTYLWSTAETTASITVSPTSTTTYTVTVTLNGCTTTVQQVITVNPIPTGAIAVTETSGTTNDDGTICNGASATLTASGGGTYLWSTAETTASITVSPTATTTYTVTVTLNGCTTTVQQVITVNPIPTGAIAVTETSGTTNDDGTICNGASATLTASGGGTYLWSPGGETTAAITVSPTSTTTYTVTVTLNGCTTTVQQVITVNPIPTGAIAVTETSGTTNDDGTICAGASATLTASGGGTYLWSNTETTASITVSPTSTTTYTVTVTLNGCTTTVQQVITVNPIPTGAIAVTETSGTTNDDGTICAGASATLTASGGGTYLWSPGGETTAAITVSPTSTTTYTVTVTLNGCTTTVQQVITVNPIPTGAIAVTETSGTTNDDGTICAGASATLTASGGGTYLWSNTETTASITVSPTSTTTYTVTVTLNGCTTTVQQVITVNPIPTGAIAVTETSGTTNDDGTICNGASATLTASGGGTYLWSNTETTASITISPTSTTTYTVTVTLNGCTTTVQQVITVNPIPTGAIAVTETSGTTNDDGTICNGASATLTASGGGTYLWSNTETTASITVSPTSTTTYTVTVTLNGCTTTVQQVITVNPIPTGAIAVTETSGTTNDDGTICNGASATLTASGGGTYLWSNAETTASITVSPTSTTTYTVTVTLNGCTTTVQQVITVNPIPTGTIAVTETSGTTNDDGTICNGASATLTASGGGTYLWSNTETTASITVSPTSTTTYTVTVTLNGCTTTVQQVITVNPIPTGAIVVTETSGTTNDDGTICNGASATLTASGGGTYLWSNTETTASITVSPTSTTTYTVTVTLNGCTTTVQQVITVNPLPSASITIAETSGTANNDGTICAGASVTLTASGGSSYLWSTMETTASITVTPSATTTYMVLVTNSNNCSTTTSQAIIVDPLPTPSITVAETSGLTNNDGTVCSGDPVTLTASGGGTYLWSNSETTAAITVNPSATTTYTVTVTNASNCSATATQVITVVSCNDISGKIIWEGDRLTTMTGVNEVTVTLSGDASDVDITGIPGTYMVSGGTGSNFVVTPKKNKPMPGAINGLSSADASRIQQHVIGAFPITDSYKLIAADANKNNSVTAADANLITQAILGNPVAQNWFSNNTWRFVPKAYVFPVPTSPWGFPETITLTGGASDQDFIGCKLGDVNTTANPANFAGSVVPELIWSVQDKLVQAGEEFTIDFNANGFDELLALQFALRFDPEKLQMLEVLPLNGGPLQTGNFGLFNLAGGEIRSVLAMTQTMSWPEGATAFQIRFKALENNVLLSDVLNLDASIIDCESYTADYTKGTVGLVFEGISTDVSTLTDAGLSLLQNRPNPFRDETLIGFVLPADCEVQLRIFDASGRLVAEQKGQFNRGYNALRFELGGVEQGLLYYELVTPFGTRARKMVLARE